MVPLRKVPPIVRPMGIAVRDHLPRERLVDDHRVERVGVGRPAAADQRDAHRPQVAGRHHADGDGRLRRGIAAGDAADRDRQIVGRGGDAGRFHARRVFEPLQELPDVGVRVAEILVARPGQRDAHRVGASGAKPAGCSCSRQRLLTISPAAVRSRIASATSRLISRPCVREWPDTADGAVPPSVSSRLIRDVWSTGAQAKSSAVASDTQQREGQHRPVDGDVGDAGHREGRQADEERHRPVGHEHGGAYRRSARARRSRPGTAPAAAGGRRRARRGSPSRASGATPVRASDWRHWRRRSAARTRPRPAAPAATGAPVRRACP